MKRFSEEEVRAIYEQGEDAMVALFMPLQEQLRVLTERVNELEGRLKKNSQNSDKPPSSDGSMDIRSPRRRV